MPCWSWLTPTVYPSSKLCVQWLEMGHGGSIHIVKIRKHDGQGFSIKKASCFSFSCTLLHLVLSWCSLLEFCPEAWAAQGESHVAGNQGLRLITHWAPHWVTFVMSDSSTLYSIAHRAPLPMGFSRQAYWSGLSCPSPGDLPKPWIEPRSPALQADSLLFEPPRKPSQLIASTNFPAMWESLLRVDPPAPSSITPADTTENKVNPFP